MTVEQFGFFDDDGNLVGGTTIAVDPATPREAFACGFHIENGASPRIAMQTLFNVYYPHRETWIAFRARDLRYRVHRIVRALKQSRGSSDAEHRDSLY